MKLVEYKDFFDVNGNEIFSLAENLWSFNRSITGEGVRLTLKEIRKQKLPNLKLHEVSSGTKAFDWIVPDEWAVKEAYIITPKGEKICDFKDNNLHLLGYSTSINKSLSLTELK